MSKLHIKKGDTVYVNAGNDKGKTGRVLRVIVWNNRAVVEGLNIVSNRPQPRATPPPGKPTRVGRRKNEEGKTVRYSKKSGEEIK